MRRLKLFVEGDGDFIAVPLLVRRILSEKNDWHGIFLDNNPYKVGAIERLVKEDFRDWRRFLAASIKESNLGGVLPILDGDADRVGGKEFCAAVIARSLADAAKRVGAGGTFSVAVVFASKEYESS
jgi:hypothetical protein